MEENTRKGRAQPVQQPESAIRVGGYSSAGPQRARNEDAFALPKSRAEENRLGVLLVVADGVGGTADGSAASGEAVAYLQSLYYSAAGPELPGERIRQCVEAVNAINRIKRRSPDIEAGFLTTLVAAVVLKDQIWIANVGDSRAYLIQAQDRIRRQLTEDHNQQTRRKKTDPDMDPADQAKASGIIYRAIGMEDECQVDLYHYTWICGDRLVLCTDGMASLPADEMIDIVRKHPPKRSSKLLVERSLRVDGSDNCTAVVAAIDALNSIDILPNPTKRANGLVFRRWFRNVPVELVLILLIGLFLGWISALIFFALFVV